MKSFSEQIANLVRPEKKTNYVLFVYNAGTVFKYEFNSKLDVQKRLSELRTAWKARDILHEIVEEPDDGYAQAKEEYDRTYAFIVTSFLRELRAEYCDIPDKAYDILIDRAYDRSHSMGYDEVATSMSDLVDLYWELSAVFSADPDHNIKELVKEGQFIKAVKAYRDKYGVGLKEAKTACDEMRPNVS